ncbi:DUF4355 domain-containing protein [Clostridium cochlearium]|uniref:DUF4355 domain-containing protein n=1 Tax=Clostridium cochlearium TaxID=1494 RepID=UPI00241C65B3|nr:DUF4355 domain-containing protein [Clostridium cochlearium]
MDKEENLNNEMSTGEVINEQTTSEGITLSKFIETLENEKECKSYFDSLMDKRVNKAIETWKTNNLEKLVNEEINKRYPPKTESEIKLEEMQIQLEKIENEKNILYLISKYKDVMVKLNLPVEFGRYLIYENESICEKNIKEFQILWSNAIEKAVNEKLRGSTPRTGSKVCINQSDSFEDIVRKKGR